MCSPSTCRRSWHCTVVLLPLLLPNHGMNRETQRSVKQELEGVHPALLGIALRDHGTMTIRPSRAPKSVPTNPAKAQAFWIAKQLSQRLGEIRHLLWHRFFGIDVISASAAPGPSTKLVMLSKRTVAGWRRSHLPHHPHLQVKPNQANACSVG